MAREDTSPVIGSYLVLFHKAWNLVLDPMAGGYVGFSSMVAFVSLIYSCGGNDNRFILLPPLRNMSIVLRRIFCFSGGSSSIFFNLRKIFKLSLSTLFLEPTRPSSSSADTLSAMIKRGIERYEVERAIIKGEIIEEYPDDKYSPSCLIYGETDEGRSLHMRVSLL